METVSATRQLLKMVGQTGADGSVTFDSKSFHFAQHRDLFVKPDLLLKCNPIFFSLDTQLASTPLAALSAVIEQLQTCWRTSLSYGDELSLHIGARIPYSQKSMSGKEKGAWILGTRGTAWRLDSPSETLVTSEDGPEILRQKVHVIEDTPIAAFKVNYPDLALTVMFGNGCKLMVIPDAKDNSDLPYWELFTPYRMLLKVGPSAMWLYVRSDLPENTYDLKV